MAKKITIVFLIIVIGIICITNLAAITSKVLLDERIEYAYWEAKLKMVNLLGDGVDTVIFGDSTAHGGYKSDELGSSVFNFALDATSPIEGYFFLKYMIANGKRPKNIVLTYSLNYWYASPNFWDYQLGFRSNLISRAEAEEILAVDQRNGPNSKILPYAGSHVSNGVVRIPYYYDIASGSLSHVKLDFNRYVKNLFLFYDIESSVLKARGYKKPHMPTESLLYCVQQQPDNYDKRIDIVSVVRHYLTRLVELAEKENIKVYIVGGPMPESCVNLGSQKPFTPNIDYLKKFKAVNVEYALPIAVPDQFMGNREHANYEGSLYFTKKVKPFFDQMQK